VSYARLSELALAEAEAIRKDDRHALEAILEEREIVISSLPAEPPADAGPHLQAAQRQAERTERWLEESLVDTVQALGRLRMGRRALSTYAESAPRLLDASA
jgi:hypothetical protein